MEERKPVPTHTMLPDWMQSIPARLRRRLLWKESTAVHIPQGAIVLLYTGKEDGDSLDEMVGTIQPELKEKIVAFDILRCKRTQDMLMEEPYNSICTAASRGRVTQVGGGPNCRTWSVRLLIEKPGGGLPCRGTGQTERIS